MPRRRQVPDPDAIYHVTFRAPALRQLFRDDADRDRYLELLAMEMRRRRWVLYSYCLLGTHGHQLLQGPDLDLGDGLKPVHEQYAVEFNRKWGEHGTLFSNGPSYTLVRSDAHLLAVLRYIARNPVAAGLCAHPIDWRWSAHPALAGLSPAPEFLAVDAVQELLGGSEATARYRSLVALDDHELIEELRIVDADRWIAEAVDDYSIPVPTLAAVLDITGRAVYGRLTKQRELRSASKKGRAPG